MKEKNASVIRNIAWSLLEADMELGKMMMMRTLIILLISVDCILGELTGSGWRLTFYKNSAIFYLVIGQLSPLIQMILIIDWHLKHVCLRCGDGDIIQKEWVCDGYSNQCRDNSDESKEPGGMMIIKSEPILCKIETWSSWIERLTCINTWHLFYSS